MAIKKAYWEQGEWDDPDHELSLFPGKEFYHVQAEDVRKTEFLRYQSNADSSRINKYKIGRDWESMILAYSSEGKPTGWVIPYWIRQSLHGSAFNTGIWGGGTVWYCNNYAHLITKFETITTSHHSSLQPELGKVAIVIGSGTVHVKSKDYGDYNGTVFSVSASSGYSDYNRFRVDTPVEITSYQNNITGWIRARYLVSGTVYLFLTPVKDSDTLIPGVYSSGTNWKISCEFGGDYYMTWKYSGTPKGFDWNDVHWMSESEQTGKQIYCVSGDTRPPDGGFLSKNYNTYWHRTVNPYLYHHFDANSNRKIGYGYYAFASGTNEQYKRLYDVKCSDYPSWIVLPRQCDPKENIEPYWYTSLSKGKFRLDSPVEIKSNELTQPSLLGSKSDMNALNGVDAYGTTSRTYIYTTGDQQYTGFHKQELTNYKAFVMDTLPFHDDATDLSDCDYLTYTFTPSKKFPESENSYTDYQSSVEFYCSCHTYLTHVGIIEGDLLSSDFISNYETINNLDWDSNDRLCDSFPQANHEYFNCNNSTFEHTIRNTGHYHWYYDNITPYKSSYARFGWIQQLPVGGGNQTEETATTRYPDAVGTWRRTWDVSLGRVSDLMIGTSSNFPVQNTTSTANDHGIRSYPNDPRYNESPTYSAFWPGMYVGSSPKLSVFRTNSAQVSAILGTYCSLNTVTGLFPGARLMFVSDLSGTVASAYLGSLTITKIINHVVYFDGTIFAGTTHVQWDQTVIEKHDANGYDTSSVFERGYEILHRCREVLRKLEFKKGHIYFQKYEFMRPSWAYASVSTNPATGQIYRDCGIEGPFVNYCMDTPHFDSSGKARTGAKTYIEGWLDYPPKNPTYDGPNVTKCWDEYGIRSSNSGIVDKPCIGWILVGGYIYSSSSNHYYVPGAAGTVGVLLDYYRTIAFRPATSDDNGVFSIDENRPPVEQDIIAKMNMYLTSPTDSYTYAYIANALGAYMASDNSNAGESFSNYSAPKTITGFNPISFTVGDRTWSGPAPKFDNYFNCVNYNNYGNGWSMYIKFSLADVDNFWYVAHTDSDSAVGSATYCYYSDHTIVPLQKGPQQFSTKLVFVDMATHSDIGYTIDPDKYSNDIWKRDFTAATFYYSTESYNNPPWPDPAEWKVPPILTGNCADKIVDYTIRGTQVVDGTDYYFYIDLNPEIDGDYNSIIIHSPGNPQWNGTYTVLSTSRVYVSNKQVLKIRVSESIASPYTIDITHDFGDMNIEYRYPSDGVVYDSSVSKYYFVVADSKLKDIDLQKITVEGNANWNGSYTVDHVEKAIYNYTTTRYRIYVNETVSNPSFTLGNVLAYIKVLGAWYLEGEIKLCEDYENEEVQYRAVSSYVPTPSGTDYTTDWSTNRDFKIHLGTTTDVYSLFESGYFSNLCFQPQAKDNQGLSTTTDTHYLPKTRVDYFDEQVDPASIWPPTAPFFSTYSVSSPVNNVVTVSLTVDNLYSFYDNIPIQYSLVHRDNPSLDQPYQTSRNFSIAVNHTTDADGETQGWKIRAKDANNKILESDYLTRIGSRPL